MRATGINHVSVPAVDVDASVRFYCDLFGMEEVPAPSFAFPRPVRWLRLGEVQLHIFPVEEQPAHTGQHFAIEVDDFEGTYLTLKELGLFCAPADRAAAAVWVLPSGQLQMYLRDPADNLIEINAADVSALDRSVFGDDLRNLDDVIPQSEENRRARLFLREPARA